jgi:hypothetical protein
VVVALEGLGLFGVAESLQRLLLGRVLLDETSLGQTDQPLLFSRQRARSSGVRFLESFFAIVAS